MDETKAYYRTHADAILSKRYQSPDPVRRRTHEDIYDSVLACLPESGSILDAGCGEGVLSVLMARRGRRVTAVDLSLQNVAAARRFAAEQGQQSRTQFLVADSERLPFRDGAFAVVVSNHVLEHLPDFDQGLREIHRVTRGKAVIAVPTCLSLQSWALLGGGNYWRPGWRAPLALPFGLLRVLLAGLLGREGVNEGYAGRKHLVHIFRFPRRVRQRLERCGFRPLRTRAQSLRLPYVARDLPWLWRIPWLARNGGLGTVYLVDKAPGSAPPVPET